MRPLLQRAIRLLLSLAGVATVTFVAFRLVPVNATTAGLAYPIGGAADCQRVGFSGSAACLRRRYSGLQFFFLPPVGKFTIADPQNWIAMFSFLAPR